MKIVPEPVLFDWDKGNSNKNLKKHKVSDKEAEEVLGSRKKFIFEDETHSLKEIRYMIWGETNKKRKLAVFFTMRNDKVRVISARDMSRRERREYEKKIQTNSKI